MNYTYLLRCADGSLYCGWTNDLDRRVAAHNAGLGGKYTRSRRPVQLIWWESFETRQEAMRREARIKRMTRAEKLYLIQEADQRQLPAEAPGSRPGPAPGFPGRNTGKTGPMQRKGADT